MVNIVTPEHVVTPEYDITDFDENLDVIWEQQIQNNAPTLDIDMDLDWNATFDENLEPFDVVMDDNNTTTWDEDYIPDPPVLVRQNAMDHVTFYNNLNPTPIPQPVNVIHYIAPNHNLL
jgi:hypothetical protein